MTEDHKELSIENGIVIARVANVVAMGSSGKKVMDELMQG
jgi:hypothetical protein